MPKCLANQLLPGHQVEWGPAGMGAHKFIPQRRIDFIGHRYRLIKFDPQGSYSNCAYSHF